MLKIEKTTVGSVVVALAMTILYIWLIATVVIDHKRIGICERAQVDQSFQLEAIRKDVREFIPAATGAIVANKKNIDSLNSKVFPQKKAKAKR